MRPVEGYLEKGFSPFNCWTAQEHHPTFFPRNPVVEKQRGIGCVSILVTNHNPSLDSQLNLWL